ncbi:MAG TPA: glutathione peroxidase [Candidatus Hydrogenedentes bacterium]|nr:glutathione peroxidase [Candidatus Hydrogenedentota bacterium]HNT89512.1 glutathione peroxidase [Candidatus Hydrogenedentota bacterium]
MKFSYLALLVTCCGIVLAAVGAWSSAKKARADKESESTEQSPLDFKVKNIDGEEVDLAAYRGKVVLIVNVASKCGLTPQYAQLQALFEKYRDQGLAILGFPANNFLGQEPGKNDEIKAFCSTNYGVEFDLFAKISVAGDDIAPLYAFLTSKKRNGEFGGRIAWNFTKFLVDREGKVIARFGPRTRPEDKAVVEAVEKALAAGS